MNDEENSQYHLRMSWFGVIVTLVSILLVNIAVFTIVGNTLRYTPLGLLGSGTAGLALSGGVSFVLSSLTFFSVCNNPENKDEPDWKIFLSIFITRLIYVSLLMWGLLIIAMLIK